MGCWGWRVGALALAARARSAAPATMGEGLILRAREGTARVVVILLAAALLLLLMLRARRMLSNLTRSRG